MNIRIAGFGGQGIVMAGYLLGHAGVLDGGNALQTQAYGSESRGGACKSDVIISDGEILDLAPPNLDVLVAMSQPALDKFGPNIKAKGILIYESDLVRPGEWEDRAVGLPATALALTNFKREVVANVIMVGCLAGYTEVVSPTSCRAAIEESVPPKTVSMNLSAFEEGFNWGMKAKKAS